MFVVDKIVNLNAICTTTITTTDPDQLKLVLIFLDYVIFQLPRNEKWKVFVGMLIQKYGASIIETYFQVNFLVFHILNYLLIFYYYYLLIFYYYLSIFV